MEKGDDYVAPRNDVERKLATIWSEVLKRPAEVISIADSFFRLGGHSLKAAVMITQVHKSLDVKLKMSQVFEHPTIAELSQLIGGTEAVKYSAIEEALPKDYYIQTSEQKRL